MSKTLLSNADIVRVATEVNSGLFGRSLLAANEQQIQKDIRAGLLIEVVSER
ncbi:MAG: hypothetical protein KKE30_09955 [Gammaproteobacteria bacterium]|nr:hypothetical protein [Gammaproteobacteria bacterium]MBU1555921.1 hypothetical protein [Gammaproteobacteria bacterium]MBU2069159.1 hypothetical protein [Gammaproteobacteria bacterium]MBU2184184.1 hypothetical protein [Gammaproteobacteria bacterium]MBU2204974.1 hypothetical protein [Gammaproteobacteria bacterium]